MSWRLSRFRTGDLVEVRSNAAVIESGSSTPLTAAARGDTTRSVLR